MNMQETKDISLYRKGLRDKIIDLSIRLFTERGIRGVTMNEVAATLGISKRTLYEIFDKKEDVLFEGVRRYFGQRRGQLELRAARCTNVIEIMLVAYKMKVEEFRKTNPQFYADLVKYPRVAQLLSTQQQKMRSDTDRFIQRGIKEGYFRKDVNYKLVTGLFDAVGKYVSDNQLYRHYSIEEIFHSLVFVPLRGLCTAKGVAALDNML